MEKVTILKVETAPSIKNIKELKEHIKNLKEQMQSIDLTTSEGMKEYNKAVTDLQVSQNMLRDAMHATTASFDEIAQAAKMTNVEFDENNKLVIQESVSYNELVHKLGDLKQAWRATTDETERAKLTTQIESINNRLKEMDASVGNFQRNVGNYKSALDGFSTGMASMGKGAAAAVGPIKNVTVGLQTMSKTPVIAILGILVNVLSKVVSALKNNEEGAQKLQKAMAPLQALGDLLTKTLQAVADVVVGLVQGFMNLTSAIFGTNKATEKRIELAKQEKALATQQRETIIKNAEAERDIAELRAKSADKLNYTAAQRLEFLKEAGEKEKEIAARALQDAKLQYEIIKAKNALTKSSKQDLDAEAQAYANLLKVETNYYNTIRGIQSGINRATREEAKGAVDAMKLKEEARKAELEAYRTMLSQEIALLEQGSAERLAKQKELLKREYEAAVKNAKDKITNEQTLFRTLEALRKKYHKDVEQAEREHQLAILNNELTAMENTANRYEKGSLQNLKAMKELRLKEVETMEREEGETIEAFNKRKIAAQWAYVEAMKAVNEKVVSETIEPLNEAYAKSAHTTEQTLEYEAALAQATAKNIETLGRNIGETDTAYETRLAEAQNVAKEKMNELLDYQQQQDVLAAENRMNSLQEGSLEYLAAAVEYKKAELDAVHKLETESDEEFKARMLAADKDYYNAKKALSQAYLSTLQSMASGISNIFGSIADIYESDSEATEKQVKASKNLRIAGATIDMLSGIVSAISTAQELGPIAGPIMAAVNSAAVIAAGVTNIAKIRAQQVSKSGSTAQSVGATPASVSAPVVVPEVSQVRTITGASAEDALNRISDQRVYILSSDIEASQQSRKVQVDETTF